jgi:hypothetical protein
MRLDNVIKLWKAFIESLGTLGGNLFVLTIILFAFMPLLLTGDSENVWKLLTFVLGALTGTINSGLKIVHPDASDPNDPPVSKKTSVTEFSDRKPGTGAETPSIETPSLDDPPKVT